jgi:circadian clock protein KaiB
LPSDQSFEFCLYVTGITPRNLGALARVIELCEARLAAAHGGVEIEVIDVLKHPGRAAEDGVVATPLVIRTSPLPPRQYVGSLEDAAAAAEALGLP